ncbi:hypothetical protein KJE01_14260 [Escherichia marmotae]|uniref:hypothetical protein n=1 Tax=Escherichia TaxID=561 RepID=UPI001495496D|nr:MULTISPECIES: hypothetical protein [Escherichia]EES3795815.1 hypothetical protein [Escherichia coli]EFI5569996.1 hypothetical protein [Escherichia coli]EFJ3039828.1 hypothetical protein [Escherichia coli]EGM8823162.1 hypothetical protein [Escherichia coli]MDQ9304563.1 hypothetical protein [Escherichia marmotae]
MRELVSIVVLLLESANRLQELEPNASNMARIRLAEAIVRRYTRDEEEPEKD